MELKREKIYLDATLAILQKMDEGPYVENVLEALIVYDDTECEGSCLVEDITHELGEEYGGKIETRGQELLKATIQLFNKQEDSPYVLEILSETVFYDEADCDGGCLMEDIKEELILINEKLNEKPKKKKKSNSPKM